MQSHPSGNTRSEADGDRRRDAADTLVDPPNPHTRRLAADRISASSDASKKKADNPRLTMASCSRIAVSRRRSAPIRTRVDATFLGKTRGSRGYGMWGRSFRS